MANVFCLTTASPHESCDFGRFTDSARHDRSGVHRLCDDENLADLILFVSASSPDCRDIHQHPLFKRFSKKCFLFDSRDRPIAYVPGVYACIERSWYWHRWVRSGFYLQPITNASIDVDDDAVIPRAEPSWLYSFVGRSSTHPVRSRIMQLRHIRSYVKDTNGLPRDGFAQVLKNSKFVLCPRGFGASSIRLFETLKAGRVPVVISDAWVPPEGPDWSSFSLRICEAEIASIPRICEENEYRALEMGRTASDVWQNWFGLESAFHRIVESCLDIQRNRPCQEFLSAIWTVAARVNRRLERLRGAS